MPIQTKDGQVTETGKLIYLESAEFLAGDPAPEFSDRSKVKLIDYLLTRADEIGIPEVTRSRLVVRYAEAFRRCTPEQRQKLLATTSPRWNG